MGSVFRNTAVREVSVGATLSTQPDGTVTAHWRRRGHAKGTTATVHTLADGRAPAPRRPVNWSWDTPFSVGPAPLGVAAAVPGRSEARSSWGIRRTVFRPDRRGRCL
jgi:hypothetical protein